MPVRWLHLSDIHEHKSERFARRRMYVEIIKEVAARKQKPDFVFLTGDLAFAGARDEYLSLEKEFVLPLKAVLPSDCRFFTVPGNHDLDRSRAAKPRLWIGDSEEVKIFQQPDELGARKRNDMLLPRFAAYSDFDRRVSDWGHEWLRSEAGSAHFSTEVGDAKISVVGINTAWLCQDDNDWGRLTPGRYLLERSLEVARSTKPDLIFVLGHHPLDAFGREHEPRDGERVRQLLTQANDTIYLHGHLHTSGRESIGDAFRSTLAIQAPSAFQAADSDRWRNGILWAEADLAAGTLIYEPFEWNGDRSEYQFDTRAGYNSERAGGRDAFQISLPGKTKAGTTTQATATATQSALPAGWEIIEKGTLAEIRSQAPSVEEMIGFFDGMLPNWRLALAEGVRPRGIAAKVSARFRAAHSGSPKPLIVLLEGAGGEGKSTAILHAAVALVEDKTQHWSCLHRQASAATLPEELLTRLPLIDNHAWVVVIDDADNTATSILAAVRNLAPRTDVHFLLAARDTDWRIKRLIPGMWQSAADFRPEHLFGLDEEDARRIVQGWMAWGDEAMGRLRGSSEEHAIQTLLEHARDLATRSEAGEFLGALLVARQGEDMKAHVRAFVDGLGREPVIGNHSLRDIYAMVAAMHAENQLYLSRSVLAFELRCEVDELERIALRLLRREAMLDAGDTYVLTRHRRIAEAACMVLREDQYDVDALYPRLARAGRKHFLAKHPTPEISDWTFGLAQHFANTGRSLTAIVVAKAVVEADPDNVHCLAALSRALRHAGRSGEAMVLLNGAGDRLKQDRGLLYEWSNVAGRLGDHGLSVWLAGRSLADGAQNIDANRCKLSLAGLGVAFRMLFESTGRKVFLKARVACGQLGLRLRDVDQKTKSSFVGDAEAVGASLLTLTSEQAVDAIRAAITLGADEVEADNEPDNIERLIGDPHVYGYVALAKALADHSAPPEMSGTSSVVGRA